MAHERQAVNRKERTGTVVSDRADQTIIVTIERAARHRLYRKVIRRTKRYPVHDPENLATVGDLVRIEECRPISKTKHWRLVEVLTERAVAAVAPETLDRTFVSEVQRSAARAVAEGDETAAATAGEELEAPEDTAEAPDEAEAAGDAVEQAEGGEPEAEKDGQAG